MQSYFNDQKFLKEFLECKCEKSSIYTYTVFVNPDNENEFFQYPLDDNYIKSLHIKCNVCKKEIVVKFSDLIEQYGR